MFRFYDKRRLRFVLGSHILAHDVGLLAIWPHLCLFWAFVWRMHPRPFTWTLLRPIWGQLDIWKNNWFIRAKRWSWSSGVATLYPDFIKWAISRLTPLFRGVLTTPWPHCLIIALDTLIPYKMSHLLLALLHLALQFKLLHKYIMLHLYHFWLNRHLGILGLFLSPIWHLETLTVSDYCRLHFGSVAYCGLTGRGLDLDVYGFAGVGLSSFLIRNVGDLGDGFSLGLFHRAILSSLFRYPRHFAFTRPGMWALRLTWALFPSTWFWRFDSLSLIILNELRQEILRVIDHSILTILDWDEPWRKFDALSGLLARLFKLFSRDFIQILELF